LSIRKKGQPDWVTVIAPPTYCLKYTWRELRRRTRAGAGRHWRLQRWRV